MTLTERIHQRFLVALTIMSVIGICALDMTLPPGASIVAFYVIPILISLLSAEPWLPLATTIASLSLTTLGFLFLAFDGASSWVVVTNRALALIAITVVACLALFYRRLVEEERTVRSRQTADAMTGFKVVRGLLPVCASCKNIRDDDGSWTYIETYLENRLDAHCTHSLCPECQKTLCDNLLKHGRVERDEPLLTR